MIRIVVFTPFFIEVEVIFLLKNIKWKKALLICVFSRSVPFLYISATLSLDSHGRSGISF